MPPLPPIEWPTCGSWQVEALPRGANLDAHLAAGWEFVGPLLHRGLFGHLDGATVGLSPLRQPVQVAGLSRNQRKLLNRNRRRFRIEISRDFDPGEREAMYTAHKPRFLGPAFPSLTDFVGRYLNPRGPDCREVAVYDGDRLAAVSYVLLGDDSAYSLLGLFDQDYARFSLGTHTLLEETELLRARGGAYYYPGHMLVGHDALNYKLRLRGLAYLDWQRGWRPLMDWAPEGHPVAMLARALDALQLELGDRGVECTRRPYPLFGLPGLLDSPVTLFGAPEYLDCGPLPGVGEWRIAITTDVFRGRHQLSVVAPAPKRVWRDRLRDFDAPPLQSRPVAPASHEVIRLVHHLRWLLGGD